MAIKYDRIARLILSKYASSLPYISQNYPKSQYARTIVFVVSVIKIQETLCRSTEM